MMRTVDRRLALLYFEHGAVLPTLHFQHGRHVPLGRPGDGQWHAPVPRTADADGLLQPPPFYEADCPYRDRAAKIVAD